MTTTTTTPRRPCRPRDRHRNMGGGGVKANDEGAGDPPVSTFFYPTFFHQPHMKEHDHG